MAKTEIVVHDVHVHPETGHITYTVRSRTTDGKATWDGPLKQYGIDRQALRDRFHGSIDEWEAHVALEHAPFCGADPQEVQDLIKRKGKVIG